MSESEIQQTDPQFGEMSLDLDAPHSISYAQNAEDIRLLRVLREVKGGCYVDVGAAHPENGNTTKLFYDQGWTGINIEPSPVFATLEAARPRDVNINCAVAEEVGELQFSVTKDDLNLSTTDLSFHDHLKDSLGEVHQIMVKSLPLRDILAKHCATREIHFLKIDVEGAEASVIRSNDWRLHRPWIVLVESIRSWSFESTHASWEPILFDAGYILAVFDGINRFYVRPDLAEFVQMLSYPISPLDRFRTIEVVHLAESLAQLDTKFREHDVLDKVELRRQVDNLNEKLESTKADYAAAAAELTYTRQQLQNLLNSATWRAAQKLRTSLKPVLPLAKTGYRQYKRIKNSRNGIPYSSVDNSSLQYSSDAAGHGARSGVHNSPSRNIIEVELRELLTCQIFDSNKTQSLEQINAAIKQVELVNRNSDERLLGKWYTLAERQSVIELEIALMMKRKSLSSSNAVDGAIDNSHLPALTSAFVDVSSLLTALPAGQSADQSARRSADQSGGSTASFAMTSGATPSDSSSFSSSAAAGSSSAALLQEIRKLFSADSIWLIANYESRDKIDLILKPGENALTANEVSKKLINKQNRQCYFFSLDADSDNFSPVFHTSPNVITVSLDRSVDDINNNDHECCDHNGATLDVSNHDCWDHGAQNRYGHDSALTPAELIKNRARSIYKDCFDVRLDYNALNNSDLLADLVRRSRSDTGSATTPMTSSTTESMTASSTITASNSSPQTVRTLGQNHERRIAIIGVLPPAQSGVADYTLSTIVELSQLAEVTVFVNELGGLEDPRLQVKKLSAQPFIEDEFDDYIAIIAGNHMHIPAFEYLRYFNMTTISHENRYLELWNYWYGEAGAATELSTKDQPILAKDIARYLNSLDDLPDLGYQRIAKCSATIFVHSTELATRVRQETNHPRVIVDPFVPYNLPSTASIGPEQIRQAAKDAGLKEDNLNIATFGEINIRTKGADVLVHVLSWLKSWNVHPMLHFVGRATDSEQSVLMGLAKDLGVDDLIRWHGRVTKQQMESCLIGMDVGVQLRTSSILNLSGAYADCLVHGTPTVTTEAIANEMGQPAYVTTVNNRVSPFLVAEAIVEIGMRRRNEAKEIEEERLAYIESRNPRKYAEILLKELTNAK